VNESAESSCPLCGGSGLVPVPVPQCVSRGQLVCYPGTRAVYTGAVLCDAPGCRAGHAAQGAEMKCERKRATLSQYRRRLGGADVVELLRLAEQAKAREAHRLGSGDGAWRAIVESIVAKANGTNGEDVL
jgi:hypothetical protein